MGNAGSSWTDASRVRLPGSIMLPCHWWILIKARHGFFCHFHAHWQLSLFQTRSMLLFRILQAPLLYSSGSDFHESSTLKASEHKNHIPVVLSHVFLYGCIEDSSHKTVLILLIQWHCTFHLIPFSRTWIRGSKAPLVSLVRHKFGWECWPVGGQRGSAEGSGGAYYFLKFFDRYFDVPGILNILKSQPYDPLLKR